MTKKDYELIAKTMARYDGTIPKDALVRELAIIFKAGNPMFDPEKFFRACYQK